MIQGPCLNGHLEPRTSQPGRSARDQGPLLRFLGSEDPRARYEELYATWKRSAAKCTQARSSNPSCTPAICLLVVVLARALSSRLLKGRVSCKCVPVVGEADSQTNIRCMPSEGNITAFCFPALAHVSSVQIKHCAFFCQSRGKSFACRGPCTDRNMEQAVREMQTAPKGLNMAVTMLHSQRWLAVVLCC